MTFTINDEWGTPEGLKHYQDLRDRNATYPLLWRLGKTPRNPDKDDITYLLNRLDSQENYLLEMVKLVIDLQHVPVESKEEAAKKLEECSRTVVAHWGWVPGTREVE